MKFHSTSACELCELEKIIKYLALNSRHSTMKKPITLFFCFRKTCISNSDKGGGGKKWNTFVDVRCVRPQTAHQAPFHIY